MPGSCDLSRAYRTKFRYISLIGHQFSTADQVTRSYHLFAIYPMKEFLMAMTAKFGVPGLDSRNHRTSHPKQFEPTIFSNSSTSITSPSRKPLISVMSLPTELHLHIASHLTYPDALSLKHTSRHFYYLVYTGVDLKIEWLFERRRLHLDCPHDKGCELGSDRKFCRGSVRCVYYFLSILETVINNCLFLCLSTPAKE